MAKGQCYMGTTINFKLDAGAEANLIPLKQWKEINNSTPLTESKAILKTVDGSTIDHIGKARVSQQQNNHRRCIHHPDRQCTTARTPDNCRP